jgi:hypothetical protein
VEEVYEEDCGEVEEVVEQDYLLEEVQETSEARSNYQVSL